jgi:hypothetical protein
MRFAERLRNSLAVHDGHNREGYQDPREYGEREPAPKPRVPLRRIHEEVGRGIGYLGEVHSTATIVRGDSSGKFGPALCFDGLGVPHT